MSSAKWPTSVNESATVIFIYHNCRSVVGNPDTELIISGFVYHSHERLMVCWALSWVISGSVCVRPGMIQCLWEGGPPLLPQIWWPLLSQSMAIMQRTWLQTQGFTKPGTHQEIYHLFWPTLLQYIITLSYYSGRHRRLDCLLLLSLLFRGLFMLIANDLSKLDIICPLWGEYSPHKGPAMQRTFKVMASLWTSQIKILSKKV